MARITTSQTRLTTQPRGAAGVAPASSRRVHHHTRATINGASRRTAATSTARQRRPCTSPGDRGSEARRVQHGRRNDHDRHRRRCTRRGPDMVSADTRVDGLPAVSAERRGTIEGRHGAGAGGCPGADGRPDMPGIGAPSRKAMTSGSSPASAAGRAARSDPRSLSRPSSGSTGPAVGSVMTGSSRTVHDSGATHPWRRPQRRRHGRCDAGRAPERTSPKAAHGRRTTCSRGRPPAAISIGPALTPDARGIGTVAQSLPATALHRAGVLFSCRPGAPTSRAR